MAGINSPGGNGGDEKTDSGEFSDFKTESGDSLDQTIQAKPEVCTFPKKPNTHRFKRNPELLDTTMSVKQRETRRQKRLQDPEAAKQYLTFQGDEMTVRNFYSPDSFVSFLANINNIHNPGAIYKTIREAADNISHLAPALLKMYPKLDRMITSAVRKDDIKLRKLESEKAEKLRKLQRYVETCQILTRLNALEKTFEERKNILAACWYATINLVDYLAELYQLESLNIGQQMKLDDERIVRNDIVLISENGTLITLKKEDPISQEREIAMIPLEPRNHLWTLKGGTFNYKNRVDSSIQIGEAAIIPVEETKIAKTSRIVNAFIVPEITPRLNIEDEELARVVAERVEHSTMIVLNRQKPLLQELNLPSGTFGIKDTE